MTEVKTSVSPAEGQSSPQLTRNEKIRAALTDGYIPMLPFEFDVLRGRLNDHTAEQVVLGGLRQEAMQQSSETWHDNAPADAVNLQSRTLAKRAQGTLGALHNGVEQSYPTTEEQTATLGSVVGVQFGQSKDVEHMMITGYCRELPEDIAALLPEGTEPITLSSPIAEALLDGQAGDARSYEANGRRIQIRLAEVRQFSI